MIEHVRTAFTLLSPGERWRWLGLVPLSLATALVEGLAAAVVLLMVRVLQDPSGAPRPTVTGSRCLAPPTTDRSTRGHYRPAEPAETTEAAGCSTTRTGREGRHTGARVHGNASTDAVER